MLSLLCPVSSKSSSIPVEMHAALAIAAVFVGCGSNAVFLELLTRSDPGSGIFITFSQFLFISLEGYIFTSKFGTQKRVVPIRHYMMLVFLFFLANVTNNFALKFNISMPLHMIFRSGSLITNLILGILILKRRYTFTKYLSVVMITVGIMICTVVSRKDSVKLAQAIRGDISSDDSQDASDYFTMLIGVMLLSIGLLVSSLLGIYQESLVTTYGKHPRESVYYSHLLPLPGFLLLVPEMYDHAVMYSNSEPYSIPYVGLVVPVLWLHLFGNVVSQSACINSVYQLQTECTSLTVTLVVTLRKFLSLLFSIFYFKNPFTLYHWLGTVLVFTGTLLFMDIAKIISAPVVQKDAAKSRKKLKDTTKKTN